MMIVYERATSLFLYGFVDSDVGTVASIVHKSIVISLLNGFPCSQYTVGQPFVCSTTGGGSTRVQKSPTLN